MIINTSFRAPALGLIVLASIAALASAGEKTAPADSKSWQNFNDQAAQLCLQARDLDDIALYDQAQSAIDRTLKLDPGNFDARKLLVQILTGKHEYARALEIATVLNHQVRDDIAVWGLLVDVNSALGDYTEAVRDAQWVLDLRRNSSLGFTKAAVLRETFGDFTGAMEFYEEANRRTPLSNLGERAWLLTRMARVQRLSGNPARAGEFLSATLKSYPDSRLALAELAQLRESEGNNKEAVELFERRYRAVPSTINLYDFAHAVAASGDAERAAGLFKEFETKARAQMLQPYNANVQLILYYMNRGNNPAEALKVAETEISVRHDFVTLDAYAWALQCNRRSKDAKTQMDRALSAGVRDPVFFCHAARIASALGDLNGAKGFAGESTRLDPKACPSESSAQ